MKKYCLFICATLLISGLIVSSCAKKRGMSMAPEAVMTATSSPVASMETGTATMTDTPTPAATIPPASDLIYDGDSSGFRLSDGVVTNDGGGVMTEAGGGNPGNLMRLAYSDPGYWQQLYWNNSTNVNIGANTHLVFNVRRDPGSPSAVMQFKVRINWNGADLFVGNYLGEGGTIDTAWKTAKMPIETMLDAGQTRIDYIVFINNYNTNYIVDIDNIRLEIGSPTATPTVTNTVNQVWTVTYTPTVIPTIFNHPGALNSQAQLDFVKGKIAASQQPWLGEYNTLASSWAASRIPHGMVNIDSCTGDASVSRDDAIGAYAQALLWYYSGNTIYADRSIAILNSWAGLRNFTCGSDQDKLQAGWIGSVFANAAEIMRIYTGWDSANIANLQGMFKSAYYPQLNTMSTWNGNVDLTQIDAMMSIAVFCDDQAEFDMGIQRLQARVPSYFYISPTPVAPIAGDGGNVQSFWSNPVNWVTGLQQETCRDNGHHAQFGMGSAIHAAETAWTQGTDVYTSLGSYFMPAMELLATQLMTNNVSTCSNTAASTTRIDTWEIGYNHYHNRKGFAMTQTGSFITASIRPNASRADWNICYETLTHAGQ